MTNEEKLRSRILEIITECVRSEAFDSSGNLPIMDKLMDTIRPYMAAPSLWQPIATAPKDGTWGLLYFPRFDVTIGGMWLEYIEGEPENPTWSWCGWSVDEIIDDRDPTHWMPLLKPPQSEPEEGE